MYRQEVSNGRLSSASAVGKYAFSAPDPSALRDSSQHARIPFVGAVHERRIIAFDYGNALAVGDLFGAVGKKERTKRNAVVVVFFEVPGS